MTLHIFNPEHDIALAADKANFTSPHAGRQLHHDLGFLPLLWATREDCVLVDDVKEAAAAFRKVLPRLRHTIGDRKESDGVVPSVLEGAVSRLIARQELGSLVLDSVDPWGWDRALCGMLGRNGVGDDVLPSDDVLDAVRRLSHRRFSAAVLSKIVAEGMVGEAHECTLEDEVNAMLSKHEKVVVKAPWSSSGRGVRFIGKEGANDNCRRWMQNVVKMQGSVMCEPYYNKVKDFGMEFHANGDGTVSYIGLSLFHTTNGAYTGNILATENHKLEMLSNYVDKEIITGLQSRLCVVLGEMIGTDYQGPLGVDMMIVGDRENANEEGRHFLLHPCVEINMRRTMGHVAIAISPSDDDVVRVMRIEYAENNYKLKIEKL